MSLQLKQRFKDQGLMCQEDSRSELDFRLLVCILQKNGCGVLQRSESRAEHKPVAGFVNRVFRSIRLCTIRRVLGSLFLSRASV